MVQGAGGGGDAGGGDGGSCIWHDRSDAAHCVRAATAFRNRCACGSRYTVKPLWVISARRALILIHVFVFGWSSQINTCI